MSLALEAARSLLFVPGNRPERLEKAARSGADCVIVDLEDSVPAGEKAAARHAIAAAWQGLGAFGIPVIVRVNAEDTEDSHEDLRMARALVGLQGVMVPKAESSDSLLRVGAALPGVRILPIVETAAGYTRVESIAATPGVVRLAVGHIDFMADTGITCGRDEAELDPLRFAVAVATRNARLAPAVDGVTVQTDDEQRLREDALRAKRFGSGGKLCIHPRQVAFVNEVFTPTSAEIAWARRVVEADAGSGGSAVRLDGRMVDKPIVLQAQRLLARAALYEASVSRRSPG